MIALANYQVKDILQQNEKATLYRAERNSDKRPVLIKYLSSDSFIPKDFAQLRHEFEITGRLNIKGIAHVYEFEELQNGFALILEDDGGQPLDQAIPPNGLPLSDFLKIAVSLSAILIEIHNHPLIHLMVNPTSILYDPKTCKVKLTDFSAASLLTTGKWHTVSDDWSKESLAYISPEQTGRMNRDIDWRSDLYSLGVTFYEMLTGQLPFQADDPMEWFHCHIAKIPFPLHKFKPGIPEGVSDIVMKCLSKMAEDRYQSSYGIKVDLEECLKRLKETGKIEFFFPGCDDISEWFQIPQKLYGRKTEIDSLMSIFDRVADEGTKEIVLVSGYAGIGKSFLIYEMQKSIIEQRGYFIRGKFDQYQRNIPYICMIQAFQELVQQLLTENDKQIAQWKEKLQKVLGSSGQVIVDVIPGVELIIGKQPVVQKLPPEEAQNRFNSVFQNFVHCFAQAEHPLVLYLDDLQWADLASLNLIQSLITDPAAKYLLMIGAFRDNEVSTAHPLMQVLNKIQKEKISLHQIQLTPLDLPHVNLLCADTLCCSAEKSQPLADLIFSKTRGNPFFIKQFLTSLHEEKLLKFDVTQREWQWDIEQIRQKDITDNVVEFMNAKIQKLSPRVQEILKIAACIGNQFGFHLLSLVDDNSTAETIENLWTNIQEGLIIPEFGFKISDLQAELKDNLPSNNSRSQMPNFSFLHDRVQQAAYFMIPEEEKKKLHLKIGRLMLKKSSTEELEEKIFDIVNQLNFGRELILLLEERYEAARLNLLAGVKAKDSTAYGSALAYLTIGMNFLISPDSHPVKLENTESEHWQTHYDLTAALYKERAECEYLNGNFENAEKLFETLLSNVQSSLEKADVYSTKAVLYTNQGKNNEAVELGIKGLKLLGEQIPINPKKLTILIQYQKILWKLRDKKVEDLIDLPEMINQEKKKVMNLIINLAPSTYFTNKKLWALLILKMVQITLSHGNSKDATPFAYGIFGVLSSNGFGRYETGYKFAKLAIHMAKRFGNTKLIGFSNFGLGCFVNNWVKPAQTSNDYLIEGYRFLVENGAYLYAGYSAASLIFNLSMTGKPLDELREEAGKYLEFANRIKDSNSANFFIVAQHYALGLKGLTRAPTSFGDDLYDELEHLELMRNSSELVPLHWYYIKKLQVLYLFEKYTEALDIALESEKLMETSMGQTFVPEHYFFYSLTLTALYPSASHSEKRKYRVILKQNQRKMDKWASICPENFAHKSYLMAAEAARIKGKKNIAMEFYSKALQSAKENDYTQNEAITSELAGRFYMSEGLGGIAQLYLKEAHNLYNKWGAKSKMKDLEMKYPQLQLSIYASIQISPDYASSISSSSTSNVLDFSSVLKASQAISGEIEMDEVIKIMMQLVIENAGAEKAFLILKEKEQLMIEAQIVLEKQEQSYTVVPLDESHDLSTAVVQYVVRTEDNMLINDSANETMLSRDPYIEKHQPKSILCIPVKYRGKLTGVLYMENNQVSGAFTPERIEVLQVLVSQAAISLENARLYSKLKQSEKKYRSIFEGAISGIFQINLAGQVTMVNPAFLQILGFESSQDAIDNLRDLKNQFFVDPQKWDEITVRLLRLETVENFEFDCRRKDGSIINASMNVHAVIDENRNLLYFEGIIENITKKKYIESLRIAKESAEAANRTKSQFLANISHELRTPMHAILGFTELGISRINTFPKEKILFYLDKIQFSGGRLLKLLNNLLDIAKLESGRFEYVFKKSSLSNIVRVVLDEMTALIEEKKINVEVQTPDFDDVAPMDDEKMAQVIRNLIANAVNFSQPNGTINIIFLDEQEFLRFSVSDHGVGIPEAELSNIFDKFVQSSKTKSNTGGTGLGLSICQQIIDDHKGKIWAENILEGGAVFHVQIPKTPN